MVARPRRRASRPSSRRSSPRLDPEARAPRRRRGNLSARARGGARPRRRAPLPGHGSCTRRGERDEGLALVRARVMELAPEQPRRTQQPGQHAVPRGRLDEAEAAFRQVLARAPTTSTRSPTWGRCCGGAASSRAPRRRSGGDRARARPRRGVPQPGRRAARPGARRRGAGCFSARRWSCAPYDGEVYRRRRRAALRAAGASRRRWRSISAGSSSIPTALRRAT